MPQVPKHHHRDADQPVPVKGFKTPNSSNAEKKKAMTPATKS